MKKGISLILIVVMFLLIAILGYVCVLVVNNNSSFFSIKELKNLKSQMQENINDLIYSCESYMYQDMVIEAGYIVPGAEENVLPELKAKNYSYTIDYDLICSSDVNIPENLKIYLDENGIIHLKYLFLDI